MLIVISQLLNFPVIVIKLVWHKVIPFSSAYCTCFDETMIFFLHYEKFSLNYLHTRPDKVTKQFHSSKFSFLACKFRLQVANNVFCYFLIFLLQHLSIETVVCLFVCFIWIKTTLDVFTIFQRFFFHWKRIFRQKWSAIDLTWARAGILICASQLGPFYVAPPTNIFVFRMFRMN